MKSIKIDRFVVIPVVSIYQDGKLIQDISGKPITAYTETADLKKLSRALEEEYDKSQKAESRGRPRSLRNSKKV